MGEALIVRRGSAGVSGTPEPASWADIQAVVRAGNGATEYPIGDQIMIEWTNNNEPHNPVHYIPLDIVQHRNVELENGDVVPGMFLQWHYCAPYSLEFSKSQAFYNCTTELVPGTYYYTRSGINYEFTTTIAVPAGGKLTYSSSKVQTWESATSTSALETLTLTQTDTGTCLGTISSNGADGQLNEWNRVQYGSNRWSTSAIRQYLNKSGLSWFVPQTDFDMQPSYYDKYGFVSGFETDFLNVLKPIKVSTLLNTVDGYDSVSEDTYDKFFLPSCEEMNFYKSTDNIEGPYFPYWRERVGATNFDDSDPNYKIYSDYGTSQNVWLRSAYRSHSYYVYSVGSSGTCNNNVAYTTARVAPVCVIC